jgi:hypothetical protein
MFMSYQPLSTQSVVALAFVIIACGGGSLSQSRLSEAQTAMHAAETLGAANDPVAKQSLQRARNQMAEAKRLANEGELDKGNLYLERATADAELASQQTRTGNEQRKAREAWAKTKSMMDTRAPE